MDIQTLFRIRAEALKSETNETYSLKTRAIAQDFKRAITNEIIKKLGECHDNH